jgi:flagellar biosynthesis protein FlhB
MAEESASSQEKTEEATPHKRDESRKKGSVARSAEMNSAFILVFGLLILYFGGAALATNISSIARTVFANSSTVIISRASVHYYTVQGILVCLYLLAPILLGLLVIGFGASVAQVGFYFSPEALAVKWHKLNPLTGFKKVIISRRAMAEMVKNLLKVGVIALVAYFSIQGAMGDTLSLMDGDVHGILTFLVSSSLSAGFKIGMAFLALALFDYLYQRFEFEQDIRMTKQEVKEETKTTEGDPLIKGRIRTVQRQIAYKRMMHDVPKADVVVTNPTHVAVALKYEAGKMDAPRVVAKGAELIAQRIKDIARKHDIPIIEDKVLARALYKSVDIGDSIPEKLFQAVAQLLAYIFRMKNSKYTYKPK